MTTNISIEDIFETPLQVRILKCFLEHPEEFLSAKNIIKMLSSSPSSVSSKLKKLVALGIIKVFEINRIKLYKLNTENTITQALIDFYNKIKKQNKQK